MTDRSDVVSSAWRDRGVCIISPYPSGGVTSQSGVAMYTQALVDGFSSLKTSQIVILAQRSAPVLESENLRVLPIWDPTHFSGSRISRSLQEHRPGVVHLQHEFRIFGTVAKTAATVRRLRRVRDLGAGVVVTLHGVVDRGGIDRGFVARNQAHLPSAVVGRIFYQAYREIQRLSDQVIVHHQHFADILVSDYKFDPNRVSVIPMGRGTVVRDSTYNTERVSSAGFRVLCFGYLTSYKNFELVLDVAERSMMPGVTFVFCVSERSGHDAEPSVRLRELEGRARRLEPTVEWHGYLADEDVPSMFGSVDLLLLPYTDCISVSAVASLAEGFGIPVCYSEPLLPLLGNGVTTFKLEVLALEETVTNAMTGLLAHADSGVFTSWGEVATMTKLVWDRAARMNL
ncbi:glycosyltransferase [Ferrimicrobium acidiphilum]|uniref:glycosyltransferase n=1 Tax=Ferrimicrobium acidiphilum TaxID=121039 RepID=UPI0030B91A21